MSVRATAVSRWRPMPGLSSCGDAAVISEVKGVQLFAVIDGLGHGPDAEASAQAAAVAVRATASDGLDEVFARVHGALGGLRGVVLAAIRIDAQGATFAGVGNIDIFGPEGVARPVSIPGIVGSGRYRFRPFSLDVRAGQRWVLASDGLRASAVTTLLHAETRPPADAFAEALIAQAARPNDDACVLVIDFDEAAP
ncbi:MAG: SpoIIE family protein phosphatase [Archangium sp.]|nr:SpoIIE family protein phosphatase [Archangium sp.]